MQLQGKIALVTGGGRRLGRAIALALARQGANIVVNYFESQKGAEETAAEIERLGCRAIAVRADVSKPEQVAALAERTLEKFGRLDILVNNAGIFTRAPLSDMTEEAWDRTINVNLKGTFLCAQRFGQMMFEQKQGRIINISSVGGVQPWPSYMHYCASKAGVIMLTKCLALALAPFVQVNSVAPGAGIFPEDYNAQQRDRLLKKIPLRRLGAPQAVTDLVVYLAAQADFITGQLFVVDGGRTVSP